VWFFPLRPALLRLDLVVAEAMARDAEPAAGEAGEMQPAREALQLTAAVGTGDVVPLHQFRPRRLRRLRRLSRRSISD
jgi:hypothetical protein